MSKRKLSVTSSSSSSKKNSSDQRIINLQATNKLDIIYLNETKTSWIKLLKLEPTDGLSQDEFEELWQLKPTEKLKIKIAGRIIDCPRYSKSYLKPYKFSGLNHEADLNIPLPIKRLLNEFANKLNPDLNQSLINWYEFDGSIGKHSDDTKQLKENSEIFSFSFGPGKRTFILEPKKNKDKENTYKIQLEHNTLVIMGGQCQLTHSHSVPKLNNINLNDKTNQRRLNVTFRCFK
jgi:alkylated DNA repair dioxygenase AlkB